MAHARAAIDISDMPDLVRLAEEVRASNKARVLRRAGEDVAIIVPVARAGAKRSRRHTPSAADREAFLASAGSWKGLVDAETLKKDIKEARGSDREFPDL